MPLSGFLTADWLKSSSVMHMSAFDHRTGITRIDRFPCFAAY
jgi:hypothetical protein